MFTFTSHSIQHQGTFLVSMSIPMFHASAKLDAYIGTATFSDLNPNKSTLLLDSPSKCQDICDTVNKTGVLKKTRQVDWIH